MDSWSSACETGKARSPERSDSSPCSIDTNFQNLMVPVTKGDTTGWMVAKANGEFELMEELQWETIEDPVHSALPACSLERREAIFNHVYQHDGLVFHRHDPAETRRRNSTPSMRVQVTSIVGKPRAQLVMWSLTERSEYWYSPGFSALQVGANYVMLGEPTQRETYFTYAIALGKGDAISIRKFGIDGHADLLSDEVLTLSNGGVDDDGWALL